ncbi:MAG: hypothetical protein FJ100_10020 [Deltaproteobacteria bacterium]|nr:hypothetical protein [Deltaproteobacteria bacterium]
MTRRNKKSREEAQVELPPDVIEQELWSLSAWMEKHWKTVAIGLGGVSLIWGGLGIYQIFHTSQEQGRAEASAAVFDKVGTAVIPPPENPESPAANSDVPSFPTEKARAEAVVAAAGNEPASGTALIGVLVGAAKATLGDRETQLKHLETALGTAKGTALELPLREQKATALQAAGRDAEAAAEWAEVAKLSTTDFGKALAKVRIGDLHNPGGGGKVADAARAKAAYEEAVKAARPGDKDPAAGPLAFLLTDARGKLARL